MAQACTLVMLYLGYQTITLEGVMLKEIQGLNIQICEVSPVQSNLTITKIQAETANDPIMQQLIKYIIEGWPARQQDVIQQLQSYHTFQRGDVSN